MKTLTSLNITGKPIILVFNKVDCLEDNLGITMLEEEYPNSVLISAKKNININLLLNKMQDVYDQNSNDIEIFIDYSNSHIVNDLYNLSDILDQHNDDEGTHYKLRVHPDKKEFFMNKFGSFIIEN